MPHFRLTMGEDGSAWGKQIVLIEADAYNAAEFAELYVNYVRNLHGNTKEEFYGATWIDAGEGTIPIAVQSLLFRGK